jgi:hypothetical protein
MKTRWFVHYNKPASKRSGRNIMTLHYRDTCYLVDKIKINTPCESHERKSQPRCVIRGWASNVTFNQGEAVIL